MNLHDFLMTLDQRDIKLFLKDGKLNYSAPSGAVTEDIQHLLRENKKTLIEKMQYHHSTSVDLKQLTDIKEWKTSLAQSYLWKKCENMQINIAANRAIAVRFKGNLSFKLLEQAFQQIWFRQDALRTHFIEKEDELWQVLSDDMPLPFKYVKAHELSALPILPRDKISHINKPFNLKKGPLCDFMLLELGGNDHLLTLTLHQLITDGWSVGIILSELSQIYNCLLEKKPVNLEPITASYANCLYWQEQLQQQQWPELNGFWDKQLTGETKIPVSFTQKHLPKKSSQKIARFEFDLPNNLYQKLIDLSRQEEVTLFSILLAAFNVLLKSYLGENKITVVTPAAIRDKFECEQVVGCFTNFILLQNIPNENQTFSQFLQTVNKTTANAFNHKSMPYDYLLEKYNLNNNAIPPIAFALQNIPMDDIDFIDLKIETIDGNKLKSKLDLVQWNPHSRVSLNCSMDITNSGMKGYVGYDTLLYNVSTVTEMIDNYKKILFTIVDSPKNHIGKLSLKTSHDSCI